MLSENFSGKSAIVTGAGQGIGFEICRQLSMRGCRVLLNDVEEDLAEASARRIRETGGDCTAYSGDVSDYDFLKKMVSFAKERYGQLSFLVANAGITLFGTFLDYAPASFQKVIDVNLKGTFFLTQLVAGEMKKEGKGGAVVLTSSVTGHQAHKGLVAYGMTKAAIEMMAKGLVVELSPFRIRVNAVAPGATLTERTVQEDPEYAKKWSNLTPLGKPALPEDIAQTVLFLLSDEARHITGQSVVVDGGWSAVSPQPD